MIVFAAAALLFSGEVVIGPGKTRTLDVKPSPVPVRLSATFEADSKASNVRLALLTNGATVSLTRYSDRGDLTVLLEPDRSYRLVVDNRPGDAAPAKVELNVVAGPEQFLPVSTRTWLAAGSICIFLTLATFAGVTLWRRTRTLPGTYS